MQAIEALVAQRIHDSPLAYEDVNDHDELRHDPIPPCLFAAVPQLARFLAGLVLIYGIVRFDLEGMAAPK